MSLRMVFDREDLLRVRLADSPDPMWELAFSIHKTHARRVPEPLLEWRRDVGHRYAGARRGREAVALVGTLVAARGPFPDFLTPPGPVTDFDAGCEAMLRTPRALLGTDLAAVFTRRPAPPWVQSLACGDGRTIAEVVRAVRGAHDLLVAPQWARVCDVVAADRVVRARQLAGQGVGSLLANIPGVLGWDGQVLHIRYPVDRTVRLGGRGLLLVPSYFCWHNPVTWIDPELPPVLVYQAHGHHIPSQAGVLLPEALTALFGRTRAECLRTLLVPHTTTELAGRLGVSVGRASRQAAVLRGAGLVHSERRGLAVWHSTTPLGTALLTGEPPAAAS